MEHKRLGRTLPAVINGVVASQAQSDGMVDPSSAGNSPPSTTKNESLFINGDSDEEPSDTKGKVGNSEGTKKPDAVSKFNFSPQSSVVQSSTNPLDTRNTATYATGSANISPFSIPSTNAFPKPSPFPQSTHFDFTFGNPSTPSSAFGTSKTTDPDPLKPSYPPKFDFYAPSSTTLPKPASDDRPLRTTASQPTSTFAFSSSPTIPMTYPFTETIKSKTPSVAAVSEGSTLTPQVQHPKPPTAPFQFIAQSKQPATQTPFSLKSAEAQNTSLPERAPSAFAPTNNVTPSLPNAPSPLSSFFPSKQPEPNTPSMLLEGAPKTQSPSFEISSVSPRSSSPPKTMTPSAPLQPKPTPPPIGNFRPDTQKQTQIPASEPTPVSQFPGSSPTNPPPSTIYKANQTPTKKDHRPQALDTLSKAMLLDDGGLLQQFIEHTIGPIISAAFRQRKDELSWERARK